MNNIKVKVLTKKWERQKRSFFVLSIFVFFMLAFIYDPPKDLDRYENYRIGLSLVGMTYKDIIVYYYNNGFDFIFYLGLRLFSSSQFWMQFFMAIITAMYYIEIYKSFTKIHGRLTLNKTILLIGLLCFPSVLYVVNLSRSIFALAFFSIGVNKCLTKNYVSHLIFFALSLFTHAGTIIFIGLFYFGLLLYMVLQNSPNLTKILSFLLPPSFYILLRVLFLDILQNAFLFELFFDTKYDHYLDASGTAKLEISISALLSIFCEITLSYFLINIDKDVTVKKILCLVFTTITVSLLTVDQNLLNRFILALPIFYAGYLLELYDKYKLNGKRNRLKFEWFTISSLLCMMIFSLIMYQERKSFFPFIFG